MQTTSTRCKLILLSCFWSALCGAHRLNLSFKRGNTNYSSRRKHDGSDALKLIDHQALHSLPRIKYTKDVDLLTKKQSKSY